MRDQKLFFRLQLALAHHQPSAFLLAAQLLSLVLYAVLDELHTGRAMLSALGALILMLVLWVVSRSPAANWIAWLLAIPAAVLSLIPGLSGNPALAACGSSKNPTAPVDGWRR